MSRKDFYGIAYVSISIFIWGCLGSIIDYPLLNKNIYLPGSIGQAATFFVTGIFTAILAIIIFKKILYISPRD